VRLFSTSPASPCLVSIRRCATKAGEHCQVEAVLSPQRATRGRTSRGASPWKASVLSCSSRDAGTFSRHSQNLLSHSIRSFMTLPQRQTLLIICLSICLSSLMAHVQQHLRPSDGERNWRRLTDAPDLQLYGTSYPFVRITPLGLLPSFLIPSSNKSQIKRGMSTYSILRNNHFFTQPCLRKLPFLFSNRPFFPSANGL
jgi:hypothetical protein